MSDPNSTAQNPTAKLVEQILNDPTLLHQVSDRVYELMVEEIRNQRDRLGSGRRF